MHAELFQLYQADQKDRADGIDPEQMTARDEARRLRVGELIAEGALQVAEDHLHAAFIYQHGETLADIWRAHELAQQAVALGHPEERKARWLVAASLDRWLTDQGKPQKYGTQIMCDANGCRLMEYDPATTDAERAEWSVPPLAEMLRRVDDLNQRRSAAK